jgi:hypothetical protein
MNVYWLSFCIAKDATYQDRYDALDAMIGSLTVRWWKETTSFILFSSERSIDEIAAFVESVIDIDQDIVLIGMPQVKSARIIGSWTDPDLTELMPFVRTRS